MGWTLYILECGDGTFYTGITNDLESRLLKHQEGDGAKYTRGRGPLSVVYAEEFGSRSLASKREAQVKAMSRKQKLELMSRSGR